jgi:uncharacterized membrane protein
VTEYFVVKWLHVLSATVLFGTGLGSAFYTFVASRSGDPAAAAFVLRWVVLADWIFTTTAVIVQPVSGFYLVYLAGYGPTSRWIVWSTILYLVAGACWLPVVWLQMRMRDMARAAAASGAPLPDRYARYFRFWLLLGAPAFAALLVIFYLMIAKPL